jgi:hypothetical protein
MPKLKHWALICVGMALLAVAFRKMFTPSFEKDAWKAAKSIYEFSAKDIDGHDVSLDKYRGDVCLIVNVASQ